MRTVHLFLTFFALAVSLSAQTAAGRADYNKVMADYFDAEAPGATAIVVKNGETIYHAAFGKAHVELDVEMKPEHVFRIGSITKQFTAAAILKLAEEEKIDLTDPLSKFLPEYPNGENITVTHLLNHTSGIKSYTSLEKWDPATHRMDFTPREMVDFFKDETADFAPGEGWSYNNSGYFLLGFIIEEVSGMPYGEYIETTFFEPLGMTSSYYGRTDRIVPNRVPGYSPTADGMANAAYLSMTQPYAAGSLLSTVKDLSVWYHAVYSGKVISPESFALAITKTTFGDGEEKSYGFGYEVGTTEGSSYFGHGGGIHGFLTASRFYPEEKVFVAVFTNSDGNDPGGAAEDIGRMAIGKYTAPVKIAFGEGVLESYVGQYELMPGFSVSVRKQGAKLVAQATGQGAFPLTALDERNFEFKPAGVKIRFNAKEDGSVPSFTLFQGGQETKAVRKQP